ncbi:hypothetical protein Tco_0602170 [Tanacetum coccineum]
MSTQQDIYAAGSETRPPMLNKENYCTTVALVLTLTEQTDDELTDKEAKQMEADDQAIQTILMGLLEDISMLMTISSVSPRSPIHRLSTCNINTLNNYNPQPSFNQNYMQQPMPNPEDISDPTTTMNMALVLMAKAFKLNYSTPTNNNQRISSNPHNRQIAQPAARAEGNANGNNGNHIRLVADAQKEEAGIQLQAEEFNLMVAARDIDEIEDVNENCILMANLQEASTSGIQIGKAPVYDSDDTSKNFKSLAKEADDSLDKIKVLEIENERLLRAVVSQDIMSIVQNNSAVDTFDL